MYTIFVSEKVMDTLVLADSIEMVSIEPEIIQDLENSISQMVGLDENLKQIIIQLANLVENENDFEKVVTETNPHLTELFDNCKENEFETDFEKDANFDELFSTKHGILQIMDPFLRFSLLLHVPF